MLGSIICHYLLGFKSLQILDVSHCPEISFEAKQQLITSGVKVIDNH